MSSRGLQTIDVLVLGSYVLVLLGLGLHFARQKISPSRPGGGHGFGWAPLGLSLMAATNSGIDYIQTPAVVYAFGLMYMAAVVTWIPVYFWATRVTIPFFRSLDTLSIYEYLEKRFNVWVRTGAAAIFVLWRIGWMGAALYVPCLAVKAATGTAMDVTWMIVLLGSLVTLYTMLGATRAVIWMDVLQFSVMFGGVAVILLVVFSQIPGGVGEILATTREAGRLRLTAAIPLAEEPVWRQLYLYLTTELTLAGFVIYILISQLSSFTCDQVSLQRLRAAESVDQAKAALTISAIASSAWTLTLGMAGLALFTFYHRVRLPEGTQNDNIVPHFIANYFPAGWTGLVFGGIFAASLSAVGAAINSTRSVIVSDFLERHLAVRESHGSLRLDRASTLRPINLALGAGVIAVAAQIESFGELYTAANKVLGAFFGPLLGIFILGMFSRRATAPGVLAGAAAGLATSCFLSFFSQIPGLQESARSLWGEGFVALFKNISWQWSSPAGVLVTLAVGYSLSLFSTFRRDPQPLTFARVVGSSKIAGEPERAVTSRVAAASGEGVGDGG